MVVWWDVVAARLGVFHCMGEGMVRVRIRAEMKLRLGLGLVWVVLRVGLLSWPGKGTCGYSKQECRYSTRQLLRRSENTKRTDKRILYTVAQLDNTKTHSHIQTLPRIPRCDTASRIVR